MSKRTASQPEQSEWFESLKKYSLKESINFFLVGREGFEPPKLEAKDLQSSPFDRSGIDPYIYKWSHQSGLNR